MAQFSLGFSIDKTDHTMELVNEWSPYGKLRDTDTPLQKESTHDN